MEGITTVYLTKEQSIFLSEQRKSFNFSKFVRDKLDEYMKFKKEVEDGKEEIN